MQVIARLISLVLLFIGLLNIGAGGIYFFMQCIQWFKEGGAYWPDLGDIWNAMHIPWPHTDWIGLQHIIDHLMKIVLRLPVAAIPFIVGFIMCWLANKIAEPLRHPNRFR